MAAASPVSTLALLGKVGERGRFYIKKVFLCFILSLCVILTVFHVFPVVSTALIIVKLAGV